EIRSSLARIPNSIQHDIPPSPPRFGGTVLRSERGDLWEFGETDDRSPLTEDARDADDLIRELDAAVGARGIEALAWYHPFHVSAGKWGIYIPITSVHYCATRWFNPRLKPSRRALLALNVLIDHEVIHHACEYMVAQFELLIRACCWASARDRL